jgi:sulfite exporter TauE/SafE
VDSALLALLLTSLGVGLIHTAAGPDHYIPFIAMSRAAGWRLGRTLAITGLCGLGHVLGSVLLGLLGIGLGWSVGLLEDAEGRRGALAGWLLLAFGLAYLAWGIRQALRGWPHEHLHVHADGTIHSHPHVHDEQHAHVHSRSLASDENGECGARPPVALTPWILFTIFVFGPCEPLIPLLIYPAATHSASHVLAVTVVFAAATIGTMLLAVTLGCFGLSRVRAALLERWGHALAGAAVAGCGAAVTIGL